MRPKASAEYVRPLAADRHLPPDETSRPFSASRRSKGRSF
jgi:hypothetical protein